MPAPARSEATGESRWPVQPFAWAWVLLPLALKLLVHGWTANAYGYFRDELYFLDCARHLQWGYVDDTPGIVAFFKLALWLGGSLPVIRMLAALGGVLTLLSGVWVARELGGGRFAQAFTAWCVLAAPIFLAMNSILCVGCYEAPFWLGCAALLLRIARTGDPRLWLAFGLCAGLGLEMKYTMLLVLGCLLLAQLLTPLRRELRQPAFWAGAGLALLIFLPTLLWQVRNQFPLLEDMANIRRIGKNVALAPLPFLKQQVMMLHPLLAPVWVGGLVFLLRRPTFRVLGWFFLLLLGAMMALQAKDYYLAGIYPMLFAAGAVGFEQVLDRRGWGATPRWAALGMVGMAGAILVPALLPLLPPQRLLAYQERLGLRPARTEVAHEAPLEQRLSDQFGWPELAQATARIYFSLSPEERADTFIYAENYGEAGAINQFGPALGLPPAVCAHQAHSFWGPPREKRRTFICIGGGRDGLERVFDSVAVAATHHHPWGMGFENRPIYLCRGLRIDLEAEWLRIRHWD